jgi:catechol 2,3-dioxygenase-like lactoylglutathione lyase family enzyme
MAGGVAVGEDMTGKAIHPKRHWWLAAAGWAGLLLAACTSPPASVESATPRLGPEVQFRLDHVAIWTKDIEATSRFLTEVVGWKRHPLAFGVGAGDLTVGGVDLAFVDANGLWLELVSPTGPGPAQDVLKRRGNGAIAELAFEPDDYDAALAAMAARGIGLLAMDGGPIPLDGGRIAQGVRTGGKLDDRGIRIAYWPTALTRGSAVEMYEYRDAVATDVFTIRNRSWHGVTHGPDVPRIDRIAIIVADVHKTAAFYRDVLGLRRHTPVFTLPGEGNAQSGGMKVQFIDARGVVLALVQPDGPGPLADYLARNGDGFLAEIIAEVDDLSAFFDRMKARGIHMVGTDGRPIDDKVKAHVLKPFGDRIAYFPADVSHGITIEIAQRGPRATSLIHAREASWQE